MSRESKEIESKVAPTILSGSSNNVAETILSRSVPDRIVGATLPSRSATDNNVPSRSVPDRIVGATLQPYNPVATTKIAQHNLPHWSQEGTTYWVTFRLADSLPQSKLVEWEEARSLWAKTHPEPWSEADWHDYDERFGERLETWLNAGDGDCHLRRADVRAIVENCLSHFNGERYDLLSWVVMPNHVHLLVRPYEGHALSKILQGIKGVSAKMCNALLNRTGQRFWQEESFDHIVRSEKQFQHFIRYIVENPIKAKLQEGEFSSSSPEQGSPDKQGSPSQGSPDNLVGEGETETGLSRLPSVGESQTSETGLSRLPFIGEDKTPRQDCLGYVSPYETIN